MYLDENFDEETRVYDTWKETLISGLLAAANGASCDDVRCFLFGAWQLGKQSHVEQAQLQLRI